MKHFFPPFVLLLAAAVLLPSSGRGQVVITSGLDATELAVGIFQGIGVTITNATLNGSIDPDTISSGAFSADGVGILPEEGVVLSTGLVLGIADSAGGFLSAQVVPNMSDADLESITGGAINNAMILEFDFVPDEDLILFDYVFASEEYPEWVCSYNDAFGFFLSGPGIVGPYTNNALNIALLPGTNVPVSIANVNNGYLNDPLDSVCPAVNPEFYYDNTGGADVAFDGMTTILGASAEVVAGEQHHIKLVLGDALDTAFDSGLFLVAHSFRSLSSLTLGMNAAGSHATALSALVGPDGQITVRCGQRMNSVLLFDVQGRCVRRAPAASTQIALDTADLPVGVYCVQAAIEGGSKWVRVVKY